MKPNNNSPAVFIIEQLSNTLIGKAIGPLTMDYSHTDLIKCLLYIYLLIIKLFIMHLGPYCIQNGYDTEDAVFLFVSHPTAGYGSAFMHNSNSVGRHFLVSLKFIFCSNWIQSCEGGLFILEL